MNDEISIKLDYIEKEVAEKIQLYANIVNNVDLIEKVKERDDKWMLLSETTTTWAVVKVIAVDSLMYDSSLAQELAELEKHFSLEFKSHTFSGTVAYEAQLCDGGVIKLFANLTENGLCKKVITGWTKPTTTEPQPIYEIVCP